MNKLPEDIEPDDAHAWLARSYFIHVPTGEICLFQEVDVPYLDDDDNEEDFVDDDPPPPRRSEWAIGYCARSNPRLLYCRPDEVGIVWPDCGAINIPGIGALYVQRNGTRQWRRAMNTRALSTFIPRRWEMRKAGCALGQVDQVLTSRQFDSLSSGRWDVIEALFRPQYYTMRQAVFEMLPEVPSVALNRHLMLVQPTPKTGVWVYYRQECVGTLDRASGQYIPDCSPRTARIVRKLLGG